MNTEHPRPQSGRGIQTRVMVLVGTGLVASLVVLGGAAWIRSAAFERTILEQREALAQTVGTHVERLLSLDLQVLQNVAAAPRVDVDDDDPDPERSALSQAYLRSQLMTRLFIARHDGVLLREPAAGSAVGPPSDVPGLDEALETGKPAVSGLVKTAGGRLVFALLPVRDWTGRVVAVVGGVMEPGSPRFASLLAHVPVPPGGSVDLLDLDGRVLASSDASRVFSEAGDGDWLVTLARQRRPASERRTAPPESGGHVEVVSFAPLVVAPWVVSIRQDRRRAVAPAVALRRDLWRLGPALIGLALLFAWGAARSVRRPLEVLTRAAERIAGGGLAEPIPTLPPDEVGRLGRALEHMRIALARSIEDVEHTNRELERRVEERTRELQGLYAQLSEREAWRGQLLRKVIAAQEDERKRLARELHDETSQTLSALAMGIETAIARFPSDLSRQKLDEAKALTLRTLDELHRVIYDLRPSVLDDLGLLSAIRWYAERHLETRGVAVRFEQSGDERRLAPEVETALFRVVQEAVNNIARHGDADAVLIQCAMRDEELSIEIEDDGQGFDPASLPPPGSSVRGLGLMGMRERVELLGGRIEIDASPGQGVRIAVTVPLEPEARHV